MSELLTQAEYAAIARDIVFAGQAFIDGAPRAALSVWIDVTEPQ